MTRKLLLAFERNTKRLPVGVLIAVKPVPTTLRQSSKYRLISQSIAEVGVIEPLVVTPHAKEPGRYLLLDGHLRHAILVERGETHVRCLITSDDEAFTYNKRISRLPTIQEHFMIVRAIERGVSEDKLARALNVDVGVIKRRRSLLSGICQKVVEALKDKRVNPATIDALRKMRPMRQIEAVELMRKADNYSASYAKILLVGTRKGDLIKPDRPKKVSGLTPQQVAMMEREADSFRENVQQIEVQYGEDQLQLQMGSSYLKRIVTNENIRTYLSQEHNEMLTEVERLIVAASLDHENGRPR